MSGTVDPIRVLHVDDDPDFADLVATVLEREEDRFAVETVHRASDGLERLPDGFDCVVSDYEMPGANGIEFLTTVREAYPELPFVLFTGKGSEEIASEALTRGATDYLQKTTGTEQYQLLANRVLNAVEQYHSKQRADNLQRIRTLVNDVNQALIRATSRGGIETSVCSILSESDPYRFAWIGAVVPETGEITPRSSAGSGSGYLDEVTITTDERPRGLGPAGTAIRERRVAVSQNIDEDPEFEPWREAAIERGYRAAAAVPLEYGDHLYGVLVVYADRAYAFDAEERELLIELGDDVAHAVAAIDAQEDLRSETERFRKLAESASDAIVTIDTDSTVRYANPAVEEVFGYAADELVGGPLTMLMPDRYRDRHVEAVSRFAETGERTVDWSSVQFPGLRADGEVIELGITFGEFEQDGEQFFQGVIRDVTERKAHEQKLTALNEVAVSLDASESVEDVCARSIEASQEILEFDLSAIDLEEDGYLSKVAVSDETPVEATKTMSIDEGIAGRTYRTGDPFLIDDLGEYEAADPQGPYRSAISIPIGEHGVFQAVAEEPDHFTDSDLELAVLLLSHTESALSRLERERQLERHTERMEEFAHIVSHDLRNPLNVAQGRLRLAREASASDHLDDVAGAHDRMEALINDLLTLARSGRRVREMEAIDLAALSEACWRTVATGEADLVVAVDSSIRADRTRLRQLLENLMRNAVEHGGERVTVTVGELDDRAGFYVADDGPGIPEDARERVLESGYSTRADGTGFGLTIVDEIAEAHGWNVELTDGEDGGARFDFTDVEREPEDSFA